MAEHDRGGVLSRLACGDALGRPVELHSREQIDADGLRWDTVEWADVTDWDV